VKESCSQTAFLHHFAHDESWVFGVPRATAKALYEIVNSAGLGDQGIYCFLNKKSTDKREPPVLHHIESDKFDQKEINFDNLKHHIDEEDVIFKKGDVVILPRKI